MAHIVCSRSPASHQLGETADITRETGGFAAPDTLSTKLAFDDRSATGYVE
jgi:hypothetical protein